MQVANVTDLISHFSDGALASPFRSTVPLLALAKDGWSTFERLLSVCGMLGDVSVAFERTVDSPKQGDRPSFTDAMVISETQALAIEAKWTEPRYETVATRLKRNDSSGRDSREYVGGWVELLQPHATTALDLDGFGDMVYQMLHRSASACGVPNRLPRLAYLHFSSMPHRGAALAQYKEDLEGFHSLLGSPERFPFFLIDLPLLPTAAFHEIENLKKGQASTGEAVRQALLTKVLFDFGEPQVRRIAVS